MFVHWFNHGCIHCGCKLIVQQTDDGRFFLPLRKRRINVYSLQITQKEVRILRHVTHKWHIITTYVQYCYLQYIDLLSITDMTTTQGPAIHQRYKLYVAQEPSYVLLAFGHFWAGFDISNYHLDENATTHTTHFISCCRMREKSVKVHTVVSKPSQPLKTRHSLCIQS